MLTYAASTVHPQDLTPSLLSFKLKSFYPLVLNYSGERKLSKWVNLYTQKKAKFGTCSVVVAAALAAEAEVAEVEDVEEKAGSDAATATVTQPKPKKGKAALPVKRDRVCVV